MRSTLPRFLLLAGLCLSMFALIVSGADKKKSKDKTKEPADAPPTLVSTNGGGPKWKNLKELEQYAAKGDPAACFELGDRLMTGDGYPTDVERARPLFETAANGGVADAWFRLGKIYHDGLGVEQDYAKAFDYYVQAAKRGVPEAQHNVGAMLVSARGVKRDYVEGLAWLIVATKNGAVSSAEAQTRARLAKQPADIAAAEKRAADLLQAIKNHTAVDPNADVKAKIAPPAIDQPAPFQPERVAPPKMSIAPIENEKLKPAAPVSPGNGK
ncbi:MAG TPA: tetratricopeptide repeat protein [Candidatus Didemnitutus sp.]|nr:tetratricopeptide repeat protein [Candidatus Didemnitutus sp.]